MDSHFHGNDKSGGGNDRGIKTNNIYLRTVVKGVVILATPTSLKPLCFLRFKALLFFPIKN